MSHVKNLQNLDKVIAICTGLGGNYNPGQQNLSVQELTNVLNNANAAYESMKNARSDYKDATNTREQMFEEVNSLAARILSELKSSRVMEQTVADARELTRKLAGRKASRDPVATQATDAAATPKSPKKHRARGLDYVSLADNFATLVNTVSEQPNYHPNATDLQVQALQAKVAQLKAANSNVSTAKAQLMTATWTMNSVLYGYPDSLYDTVKGVKLQMKAMFGHGSEPRQALGRIQVRKPTNL